MAIVRRIVDMEGKLISQDTLNVSVSSREESTDYIENHVAKVFPRHGHNAEFGYWWGRHDDDDQVSRFTYEP